MLRLPTNAVQKEMREINRITANSEAHSTSLPAGDPRKAKGHRQAAAPTGGHHDDRHHDDGRHQSPGGSSASSGEASDNDDDDEFDAAEPPLASSTSKRPTEGRTAAAVAPASPSAAPRTMPLYLQQRAGGYVELQLTIEPSVASAAEVSARAVERVMAECAHREFALQPKMRKAFQQALLTTIFDDHDHAVACAQWASIPAGVCARDATAHRTPPHALDASTRTPRTRALFDQAWT